MLKPAMIFSDHMILQRDKKIAVFGEADPKSRINVWIQGKTAEAVADDDGTWKAEFPPLSVSFSEEMHIQSETEELVYEDIQIGEVWLAGGQSNMEFHMRYDADMQHEKGICQNQNIRFFDYPEVSYREQLDEADYMKHYGFWRKAVPEELERFSAVGYYFAKELWEKYQIPVGIIGCNWGGTPACAWMDETHIIKAGAEIFLKEYKNEIDRLNIDEYNEKFKHNPYSYRTDQLADATSDAVMFGVDPQEFLKKAMEMGVDLSEMATPVGPKSEQRPAGLYESMLKPLAPFTIRGFLWYQGETDGDTHPELYRRLFPELIQNWRELWNEELSFLFVQLAALDQWMLSKGDPYVTVRSAQQEAANTVPHTGMAVITDVGMKNDIHPKKKQPVGQRLALLAMNQVYGDAVLCEAPTLSEVEVEEGRAVLTFVNVGEGLHFADTLPYGEKVNGNKMGGLQIVQNGTELDVSGLTARADKDKIYIDGNEIKGGAKTKVMIAETGWYQVNLYNSAGIPVRPAHAEN